MKTQRKWILPILLTGVLLLSACQPAPQAEPLPLTQSEQQDIVPGVPEIDLNQLDEFATATFSMG
jgi:hypothetical protein